MTISFLEQMKVIPDRMTGMVTYPRWLGCCAGRTITAGPAYPADYFLEPAAYAVHPGRIPWLFQGIPGG
jgi:hypothetical protein